MNAIKSTSIFLFSLLIFFGCEENAVSPKGLQVSTQDNVLKIHNGLESRVYYFVVGRNTAVVINWAPTVNQNSRSIGSQKFVELNFEDIFGYEDGVEEAIVYYWMAVNENGSLVPGNVHSVIVGL